jgi:hypothetical protein
VEILKKNLLVIDDRIVRLEIITDMLEEYEFFSIRKELYSAQLVKQIKRIMQTEYDAFLIDIILDNTKDEERKDIPDKLSVILAKKIRAIKPSANILFYTTAAIIIDQDRLQREVKNSRLLPIKFHAITPEEPGECWTDEEKQVVIYNRKKYCEKVKEYLDMWSINNGR